MALQIGHRTLGAALAIATLAVGAAACGSSDATSKNSGLLSTMKESDTARISIAQLPPYAYLNAQNQPAGYFVDVTDAVLEELGISKIEATVTTFESMIPQLQADQVDMAAGSLSITADRCKVITYSTPLAVSPDGLWVLEGNPERLTSLSKSEGTDGKVSALAGSTQLDRAVAAGFAKSEIVAVPDVQAGLATVRNGRADAFIIGQPDVPPAQRDGLSWVADPDAPINASAIGFRKTDARFRDQYDKIVQKLRENGTMERLYKKWGFATWDLLEQTTEVTDAVPECAD